MLEGDSVPSWHYVVRHAAAGDLPMQLLIGLRQRAQEHLPNLPALHDHLLLELMRHLEHCQLTQKQLPPDQLQGQHQQGGCLAGPLPEGWMAQQHVAMCPAVPTLPATPLLPVCKMQHFSDYVTKETVA